MVRPRPLIAGNWKMNGVLADLDKIEAVTKGIPAGLEAETVICPPATLISAAAGVTKGSQVRLGAQDCASTSHGAYTGDISAAMLRDAGAEFVILGHSERRNLHGETSREVRAKAKAALAEGLHLIVCVGETLGERAAGLAGQISARQLLESLPDEASPDRVAVAYEPVWAIGTGKTPTAPDISEMHGLLRLALQKRFPAFPGASWRILYGGSVTPANAGSILALPEVDGVLVGGASLKPESFLAIAAASQPTEERV